MYTLCKNEIRQIEARKFILEIFKKGAIRSINNFPTPGGGGKGYVDAETFYRPDLDIWVSIAVKDGRRFLAGEGVPKDKIGLEMTIPIGSNLHASGQIVEDGAGDLFFAHAGGLGGGKYSVKRETFSILIEDFVRSDVLHDKIIKKYFVISKIGSGESLLTLSRYVKQAEHIRVLRKSFAGEDFDEWAVGDRARSLGMSPMPKVINVVARALQLERELLHEKIQSELEYQIQNYGIKLQPTKHLDGGIQADVFVDSRNGGANVLFEIKTDNSSQSHFTAIGQLLVYAKAYEKYPLKRVLVSPELPTSKLFGPVLGGVSIEHMSFAARGDRIEFRGLKKILQGKKVLQSK